MDKAGGLARREMGFVSKRGKPLFFLRLRRRRLRGVGTLDGKFFDYRTGVLVGLGEFEEVVEEIVVGGGDLLGLVDHRLALLDETRGVVAGGGERLDLAAEVAGLPGERVGILAKGHDLREQKKDDRHGEDESSGTSEKNFQGRAGWLIRNLHDLFVQKSGLVREIRGSLFLESGEILQLHFRRAWAAAGRLWGDRILFRFHNSQREDLVAGTGVGFGAGGLA